MCDPKPGARCSADTWKEFKEAERKLAAAAAEARKFPEDRGARRRLQQAAENVDRKSAAYDSSPRGQKELAAAIKASPAPNSADVDELRTRLFVGRQSRISQKRALARSRGESEAVEILEANNALNRLRHPDGGLTRHRGIGREEAMGFFASPYPVSEAIPAAGLRAINLLRFANANRDVWGREGHYLGAWHEPETGIVSLEVSTKTTSAEDARTLAAQNQKAVFYDAQLGGPVEVGTTPRDRIADLSEGRNEP